MKIGKASFSKRLIRCILGVPLLIVLTLGTRAVYGKRDIYLGIE